MPRYRLIWQLFPAFLFIALASMLALGLCIFTWMYLRTLPIEDEPRHFIEILLAGSAAAMACSIIAAVWNLLSQWSLIGPIREMTLAARRVALDDLYTPMTPPDHPELADLASAMNLMGRQLDERIRTVVEQRNEREAILSSMVEGVIAVNSKRHIISMNRAAAELFDADPARVQGKGIQHAVRNPRVAELIDDSLAQSAPINREISVVARGRETTLQAHAAALRDASGATMGVVVVLDDVTDLRRLESMRSDFVANVSHELKTPITSIKGFVETLLDGAIENNDDARRFLGIVAKQADRLNAIIEDLLTLSRIEQDEQARDGLLAPGSLLPVIQSAAQLCAGAADSKEIRISISCSPALRTRINGPLLEQGVTNLIDNAIKYSDRGSEGRVEVAEGRKEIAISVIDQGCGIPDEHLPRLFERFYRVDKARSRQLGGTGLGLAIVKHIAQTHGGRIDVESRPGVGSTFRLSLPLMEPMREPLENAI